ncbi:MAG: glycosyl transferase family A [Mastigocladus sp. ERB_26_2]
MTKVSVVIPAYNAMTYLPETLESVLRQTFADFEVLIINDGSSDKIVEWAAGIVDPRVKLISQPNQGVSVARNTGIAQAQGEYIAFLDADDLWEPTKLEKQVRCLENNPAAGLVYTWTALIDQSGNPMGTLWVSDIEGNVWEQIVVKDMISNGSSPMVRRSCFKTVGVFDPQIRGVEDREMWIRIAACHPFAVVKEPLTLYRRHPGNMTSNRQMIITELRKVFEKAFESAPLELLYLRNQSYGWMNLFAAWGCIEDEKNYKKAMHYRQQAVLHYPQLHNTSTYISLSLRIATMRWFGLQGYERVRGITRTVRQLMLGTAA